MSLHLYRLFENFYFFEHNGRQNFARLRIRFYNHRISQLAMPQKLLQHKHCITCGKAINVTEDFCSEECETNHRLLLSKKRRQLLYLWIGAAAVLVIVAILSFG